MDPDGSPSITLDDLRRRYDLSVEVEAITGRRILKSSQYHLILTPGLNAILINGQFHRLSRDVVRQNGDLVLPGEIYALIETGRSYRSDSAPAPSVRSRHRPFKVVIDPGHGGVHTGGEGRRGLLEKDVNLDVSSRLRDLLRQAGIEVVMTRSADRHFSENVREDLHRRVEIANSESPDLFISLHSNWHRTPSARGFEIYTPRDEDRLSRREKVKNLTSRELRETLGVEPPADAASLEALNNLLVDEYERETRELAGEIRGVFASALDTEDRGVKEAGYYVIKWVRCPAVLVEMEFISNPQGERELGSPQHRQKIASLLSRVIVNFSRKRDRLSGPLK